MPVLETIAAVAAIAAKAAELANRIGPSVVGSRSVILDVRNVSLQTLLRVADHHSSGGWAVPPDGEIEPRSPSVFGSRARGFLTGTVGWVLYDIQGANFQLVIQWANPWAGSNSSNAEIRGLRRPGYLTYFARSATGAGNQQAHMLYELFPEDDLIQPDWRFCHKCQGLFFGGNPGSVCPAGAAHDPARSGQYTLGMGQVGHYSAGVAVQDGWRWCRKCQGLAFAERDPGACPAGGQHDHSASGSYILAFSGSGVPGQEYWKWCRKCEGLAYTGNQVNGACPAGGQHDHSQSGNYSLALS